MRKGPSIDVANSDTLETLRWHYKKGSSQQWMAFSNSELEQNSWENFVRIQKREKNEGNTVWYPQAATRDHTWIQRNSNFASLRGLKSHMKAQYLSQNRSARFITWDLKKKKSNVPNLVFAQERNH